MGFRKWGCRHFSTGFLSSPKVTYSTYIVGTVPLEHPGILRDGRDRISDRISQQLSPASFHVSKIILAGYLQSKCHIYTLKSRQFQTKKLDASYDKLNHENLGPCQKTEARPIYTVHRHPQTHIHSYHTHTQTHTCTYACLHKPHILQPYLTAAPLPTVCSVKP